MEISPSSKAERINENLLNDTYWEAQRQVPVMLPYPAELTLRPLRFANLPSTIDHNRTSPPPAASTLGWLAAKVTDPAVCNSTRMIPGCTRSHDNLVCVRCIPNSSLLLRSLPPAQHINL